MYMFLYFTVLILIYNWFPTPFPPVSHRPLPIQSLPIQYTSLQIVSSLTIHPFISFNMSNAIVKPFLHKHSSTVSSLSLASTSPSHYTIYGTICIPTQPTNYKCGILPGMTSPSCCPLTGTTFPLHATSAPHFACPKPTNPILPQPHPIPSLPPNSMLSNSTTSLTPTYKFPPS